jgi:soluble lytic murein transglycosylase-like protein
MTRTRSTLLLLLPVLALAPLPASAEGALYRCKGSQGEIAYTSNRAGFSECVVVSRFRPEPKSAATPEAEAPQRASTAQPAPEVATQPAPAVGAPRRSSEPVVQFRSAPGAQTPEAPDQLSGLGAPKVSRGAIYRYERDGILHYTNVKPAARDATVLFTYIQNCYACGLSPGLDWNAVGLNLEAFREEIAQAALEHGVDPALVRAVMHAESAFRPNVVSHKGAQGLMQLIPATAERFGVQDAFDPAQNINAGTRYLAWLLRRFDGDVQLAAAGYNAGEGAVDRFKGVPPYEETQRYVERVGILLQRYRDSLN